MPLELIVISLMRTDKWINVLMLNTPDEDFGRLQSRRIDVSSDGIRWIERDYEQFTPLGKFFEINTNPEAGITVDKETSNATALKLSLVRINDAALDQQTVDVGIKELQLLLSGTCTLHCTNCYNELVAARCFSSIRPMPIQTMEPLKYFCPKNRVPTAVDEGELYYALNYIVISPQILGKRLVQCGGRIHCGRCLHLVGESLGEKVAVQLYVDTLWVGSAGQDGMPEGRLEKFFGPLTVSQLMLHLLQDAVPISDESTRLFLKTVRPDGQLHYMLLLVDTKPLHLLRSKLSLIEDLNLGDYDADISLISHSDSSSESITANSSDSDSDDSGPSVKRRRRPHRSGDSKPVHEIKVRGYRGCRINYHMFSTDEELAANTKLIEQWRKEGTPMVRISYGMMMDLLRELNVNELLVETLERIAPDEKTGRVSYIIYEPDEDT
ncbi:hypothetical protein AWZ03_001701 [Drosophila navojoa]|uniref:Uncharacterized protein n=1 Tax=Drosophila navojoa TaxID=7232 RepID=A0A484BW80_DRONA|nr:uncharacterized protein LOC108660227 [Drosophila navojoa]TDG52031.1 hypothetical protein AWZ03_001701 [Drosophila navojoa]